MSKDGLLSALSESESVESKNSFDDKRLKKITRERFSKPRIKKINKNLYDIKTQKIFQNKKQKKLKKFFLN